VDDFWWDTLGAQDITQELLEGESTLTRLLAATVIRMEITMSDLTDKVDAALAVLNSDSANAGAALDAAKAATAVVQAQVDSLTAQNTADVAELQKALDALNAAHKALGGPAPTSPPAPAPAPAPAPGSGPAAKPLYRHTGTAPVDANEWPAAGQNAANGEALYTFAGDAAGGPATGASPDWTVYTA